MGTNELDCMRDDEYLVAMGVENVEQMMAGLRRTSIRYLDKNCKIEIVNSITLGANRLPVRQVASRLLRHFRQLK